jgi:GrpB-like predicted nucleotidyltransferase (UPF0157 family)
MIIFGGGTTMEKPIVKLSNYDPRWEKQFEYEKKRILDALGDKVFAIEHIGSTSIKGLQAKPIIDIIVAVENIDEISNFIHPLSKIEFEYIPKPEFKDRRFFRKGQWGNGTCHLHMCEISSSEWIDKVLFRDYLRLHPEVAEQYASLKKELSSKYLFDRPTYTKNKEPFIKSIIEKARMELHSK